MLKGIAQLRNAVPWAMSLIHRAGVPKINSGDNRPASCRILQWASGLYVDLTVLADKYPGLLLT